MADERRMMRALMVGAVIALVLFAPVLASGERSGPQTHTITIDAMKFTPEVMTAAPGDTVVWVNKDLVAHTATARDKTFDSKMIAPGESWTLTVQKRGTFAYTCTYHPTMNATLRVE